MKKKNSHNKRYDDLLRCEIKKMINIIFDDYIYHHLKHKNVTIFIINYI